jgi:hypothetical protein
MILDADKNLKVKSQKSKVKNQKSKIKIKPATSLPVIAMRLKTTQNLK